MTEEVTETYVDKFLKKKPITLLSLAYVIALSIIAGMSVGAHLVVQKVVAEQEESARVVNIAGRQRMLSQRTALYMTNYVIGERVEAHNKLREGISLFERSHRALTKGDDQLRLKGELPQRLHDIYYREPYNLDQMVSQYISDVRTILADVDMNLKQDNEIYQRAKKLAENELLVALDLAVKAYEESAEDKVRKLTDIQTVSILAILAIILLEAIIIFRPLINRVRRYSEEIEEIASHDVLTGVLNRRAFIQHADIELNKAQRYQVPFCYIICDFDHFKRVNDTYGHAVGDEALKHVSRIINKSLRKSDILGRIGGEEFGILLPHTNEKEGLVVANKIRAMVESYAMDFTHEGERTELKITTSIGFTLYDAYKDEILEDLYIRADKALYKAKADGRNRVSICKAAV